MADTNTFGNIPMIKNGITTFSESDINPILSQINSNFNILRSSINNTMTKVGYTLTDIGIDNSVKIGDLVYQDTATGLYKKAVAAYDTTALINSSAAESCHVLGVVISTDPANVQGTIMCNGVINDASIVAAFFNQAGVTTTIVPGNYYLQKDGSVSTVIPSDCPVVKCATYTGSGKLYINIEQPVVYGHTHTSAEVAFNGATTYTAEDGSVIAAILDSGIYSLYGEGVLLLEGTNGAYTVDGHTIKLNNDIAPSYAIIYGIEPHVMTETPVRSIKVHPSTKLLTAANRNGAVEINTDFSAINHVDNSSGVAVAAISNTGVTTANVINQITAGVGMHVSTDKGVAVVSNTFAKNSVIDIQLVNANNVLLGGGSQGIFLVYSADREGSVNGTCRIPYIGDGASTGIQAVISVCNDTGDTINVPQMFIDVYKYPYNGGAITTIKDTKTPVTKIAANTVGNIIVTIPDTTVESNDYIALSVRCRPTVSLNVASIAIQLA